MVGTRVLAWLGGGALVVMLLIAFAGWSRGDEAYRGAALTGTPRGYRMPPCLPTTRPYTRTITYTRDELLAIWEEGWRRDQDFLVSLSPWDASNEREEMLARRATIEAGPATVTRVINFTEIDYDCASPGPGTPGPGGTWTPPSPGAGPVTPTAAERFTPIAADCRTAPRSVERLWPLLAEDAPAPVPGLLGQRATGLPVDIQTVTGAVSAVRDFLACQSSGQPLHALAHLTDNAIRLALANGDIPREDLESLATPGASAPGASSGEFVLEASISDVRNYADGRIGAVMEVNGASPQFVTLVWRDDRWVIDAIEDMELS